MKISVIIPFYNNYISIFKTLDSLVNQNGKIHEVIIIDDFSCDERHVKNIVDQYILKLPVILRRNKENRNGAYSRNVGIKIATGDVIAFLDADDTWEPNKIRRINECVKEYGINHLFFSKVKIEDNGKIIASRPKHFNSKIHMSEYLFLEDGFIQTSSIFCSLAVAKEILFQEHFKRHQDYDFVLRAADNGIKFQFIPEDLVTYKSEHKPNASKGEHYDYSLFWLKEMQPYFSKKGVKGFVIFNLSARLLSEKRYTKAITNLISGLLGLNIFSYHRLFNKISRIIIEARNRGGSI